MKNPKSTKELRKELRKNQTPAEERLWHYLKDRRFNGIKFRRQYGFGPYILDFYAPSLNLAIEVDGNIHDKHLVRIKDINKTEFLNENGISVIRLTNEEVLKSSQTALNRIEKYIKLLCTKNEPHLSSPSKGEGLHRDR